MMMYFINKLKIVNKYFINHLFKDTVLFTFPLLSNNTVFCSQNHRYMADILPIRRLICKIRGGLKNKSIRKITTKQV